MESMIWRVLNEIPDFKEFMNVDELNASARELASKHPDRVSMFKIGEARNGEPINCLKIGSGELTALLFAFPHPNEPIGSMTLEYLSWRLSVDDTFRSKMNTTWYIIKCVDPFGARLNEGWFKGDWSLRKYALNYYRPPGYKQIEWAFPVEYKTLKFDKPIPETQALMNLINEIKPDYVSSLHNAGFCGAYFYLSDPIPDVYDKLHVVTSKFDIPLHLGEPEVPYANKFADAIFKMPTVVEEYEYLAEHLKKDPSEVIRSGASSDEYVKRINKNALTVVCEVPYIYDDRIANTTPVGIKRRDILLLEAEKTRRQLIELKKRLETIKYCVDESSPFYEALSEFIRIGLESVKARKNWAKKDPSTTRQATVSELFDSMVARIYFYGMLRLGLFYRLTCEKPEEPILKEHCKWSLKKIELMCKEFMDMSNYIVIPVRNLVGVQLGSILYTLMAKSSISN
ncbi:peptidase M14 [Candidatus Bathyarchaeota archaeon]|nr:peptidase M14 [Candidatus Bathyarchaeota archaeon]MBS7612651.1 peptidase M14 [Candidatus Bathyarchaeota archaeon]MBS7617234.1 peptidase M14 [Candidatus Bathyarchaeota archaeon]